MVKHHLLVVEDDPAIRALIIAFLEKENYRVSGAATAAAAEKKINKFGFDLIVLDLGLPDEDGLVVARKLRARSYTPIIFVTQREDRETKLAALDLGGDDYLTKPFDPHELAARIRNILRRAHLASDNAVRGSIIRFSDLELDLDRRSLVAFDGDSIDLTRAEFDLLAALVHARSRVLSRDRLLDAISSCQSDETSERLVDVLISRLRRKLEPQGKPWQLIRTVPGVGYQLGVSIE
ncbi:MAG: response regulator transcription factor [Hyphomicrobiaceae bacterium]